MALNDQKSRQLDNSLSAIGTDEVSTLEQLYEIQAKYAPSNVFLPFADNIYDVNLDTRTINSPEFLSVRRDHKSEVIYFKVDRFFDYMDLANTTCIIQYLLPGDTTKVPHIYVVPFYDTTTYFGENKMIFPWSVGGAATMVDGDIEYAIRFFRVEGERENASLAENLNKLPAKSKILQSIEADNEIMKAAYDTPIANKYEELLDQLKNTKTYWMFV